MESLPDIKVLFGNNSPVRSRDSLLIDHKNQITRRSFDQFLAREPCQLLPSDFNISTCWRAQCLRPGANDHESIAAL
jgi:hypothetical protein